MFEQDGIDKTMCGIAGCVLPDKNKNDSDAVIRQMTDIIAYRGPDDEGHASFSASAPLQTFQIALGHRRLSIVDVSILGHQPMSYAQERYWIVYNGEIYNYLELRAELSSLGYDFKSQTDTEVILAAYAEWGELCQHKLNGMWAFAIYDRETAQLFLSRDRFGIKPLYYWISPEGGFYFGSEVKQFTVLAEWKAVLNHQRAYDFLVSGLMDHSDETLFQGVYQLLPGHCIALAVPADRYSDVASRLWYVLQGRPFSGSYEQAKDEFKSLMESSVGLQMRADVPIGSCLSGGLDSSTIVCLMNRILAQDNAVELQKTFSACSNVEGIDERKWIDIVVQEAGVEAHYCYPDPLELFEKIDELIWHQDEPFGSTSIFAQWNVFRLAASNGVAVMLDGQGADEQLAGYSPYYGARLASLFTSGRLSRFFKEVMSIRNERGKTWSWIASSCLVSILPQSFATVFRNLTGGRNLKPSWLGMSTLAKAKTKMAGQEYASSVADLSYLQLTTGNLRMLLHWEDRTSMAHSVESRVPFLDHRLVEFVLGLPEDFKISNAVTKRILRDSMRGILPDRIADRFDKIGFATPEEVWLRGHPDVFREKMAEAIAASAGVLTSDAMDYFEDVLSGRKRFSFTLWRMINFGLWMKKFDVSVSVS